MSEKITFRGAYIRYFDVRRTGDEAPAFTRIHMSADFSDTVREQMEWEDPGESITSAKLTGALLGQSMILTPGDKALKQYELQIVISDASNFEVVALKDDDGEICGRQLRFIVRSPGDGVEALVGNYYRRVGKHEGQLKITYEAAKQEELPLEKPDLPATAPEATDGQEPIGTFLQGEALEQHNGKTGEDSGPSLAPASLVGGTHQRGTKQQHGRRGAEPRDPEREAAADGTAVN